ncbi:MAG: hypothetical protein R6V56_03695 [Lentisphaeria bacterium]
MFLLCFFRIKTTRSGEALQLVESYRNREGKPRQRIVVSLGVDHRNLPSTKMSVPMKTSSVFSCLYLSTESKY